MTDEVFDWECLRENVRDILARVDLSQRRLRAGISAQLLMEPAEMHLRMGDSLTNLKQLDLHINKLDGACVEAFNTTVDTLTNFTV